MLWWSTFWCSTFQQQVIEYSGCVEWPPRSPHLNPLNFFFLWGCIRQIVYATPQPTVPARHVTVLHSLQKSVIQYPDVYCCWRTRISAKCNFVQRKKSFLLFVYFIFDSNLLFCTKEMMSNNFVTDFFLLSSYWFWDKKLITNLTVIWRFN